MRRCSVDMLYASTRDFTVTLMLFSLLVAVSMIDQRAVLILTTTSFYADRQLDLIMLLDQYTAEAYRVFTGWRNIEAIDLSAAAKHERIVPILFAAFLFSSIIAFKLAFLRHLCRVHASARRGAWRED